MVITTILFKYMVLIREIIANKIQNTIPIKPNMRKLTIIPPKYSKGGTGTKR